MSNVTTDEFLEHFGVKGMHWGKSTGGSSSPGPSRTERKIAKAETRVEKTTNKQNESNARDKTIITARNNLAKSGSDLKVAKSQYKLDKLNKGKAAAKETYAKVKDVHVTNIFNANLSTAKELTDAKNEAFWNAVAVGLK